MSNELSIRAVGEEWIQCEFKIHQHTIFHLLRPALIDWVDVKIVDEEFQDGSSRIELGYKGSTLEYNKLCRENAKAVLEMLELFLIQ